jgi:cytochrome c553
MKKFMLVLVVLALGTFVMAQIGVPTGDVLGAHLNYGRGCAACHSPHGGQAGNGAAHTQTVANSYLWGQDTTALLGQTITFSGNTVEVLPATLAAGSPDVSGLLMCLSCHDGNYATGAMMKNAIYETVPLTKYGANTIPTLMGNEGALGVGAGSYLANHPVGLNATVSCGGQYNWDCVQAANGTISMTGTNSAQFVKDYGFFVSLSAYNNTAVVTCTSCHNQHLMNIVSVTNGAKSGLPTGYYQTMFFIRAPYNGANSSNVASNQNAQFCRQCHGGEANESNGAGATIPTTF